MDQTKDMRRIGIALIAFAIAFNIPYSTLASTFHYPAILREAPGVILAAFAKGGAPLILTWAGFAVAALLFAPVAVLVSKVTRASQGVAAIGIAAGVTQAIGLSRWVYAVPGLAAAWTNEPDLRPSVELTFNTLHQFAGVGIGEAIGQSLTAFWLIGVSLAQRSDPRFGRPLAAVGFAAGIVLLLGLVEGLATVLPFDPGVLGLGALVGFLLLTAWLIWTGIVCIRQPVAAA